MVQRVRHVGRGARAAQLLAVALPPHERLLRQTREEKVEQLQQRLGHDDQKAADEAQMEEGEEGDPVRDQLEDVVNFVATGGVVAVEDHLEELDDHDEGEHGHLDGLGDEVVECLGPGPHDDAPGGGVVGGGR